MELHIVTAVSRPENLPRIAANVSESFSRLSVAWHCFYDSEDTTDGYGNPQKNMGLEAIDTGWVYFLDDDNAFHPGFETALIEAVNAYPSATGFVFNQIDAQGERLRTAARANYEFGQIDLGQFVLRRETIGDVRFPVKDYCSDWSVFSKLDHADIVPINLDVTHYNYLRQAGGGGLARVAVVG